MKKHFLNVYFSVAFCLALAMALSFVGIGNKATVALAAETTEEKSLDKAIEELRSTAVFAKIVDAASKAEANADLGTFERKVNGETVTAFKKTKADGTVEVRAIYSDKSGAKTGELAIAFIPYGEGYHMDAAYLLLENGKPVCEEFLRKNASADLNMDITTGKEFILSYTVFGDSVTFCDGFDDRRIEVDSNKKKVGNSVVEECTCYYLWEDGRKSLEATSQCYTTEYEVIEGQRFSKSYCTVSLSDGKTFGTYLCIMDEYVEDGITYATRCFTWDGSDTYGTGDGVYDSYAFRYMEKDGKRSVLDSTNDVAFTYLEADDGTIYAEELYGIFHPDGTGKPAKTFSYALSGDIFETVVGGFAKMRSDVPFELLDRELSSRLIEVAVNDTADPLIYAANLMMILPNDDGTVSVAYNSYDNSEADTTTVHRYSYKYDSKGNRKLIDSEQAEVKITIPQFIYLEENNFEADASELADAGARFNLVPMTVGKASFKKVSGDENIKVSKKGKVTIAKGTYEPGTVLKFKVKVKAKAGLHATKAKKNFSVTVAID